MEKRNKRRRRSEGKREVVVNQGRSQDSRIGFLAPTFGYAATRVAASTIHNGGGDSKGTRGACARAVLGLLGPGLALNDTPHQQHQPSHRTASYTVAHLYLARGCAHCLLNQPPLTARSHLVLVARPRLCATHLTHQVSTRSL